MKTIITLCAVLILTVAAKAGIVSQYQFNGNANDLVGTNHGTLHSGATTTTDSVRGSVLWLDGSNDYVSLSTFAVTTNEFTISAWAKPDGQGGGPDGANIVFQQRNDASTAGDAKAAIVIMTDSLTYAGVGTDMIRNSNGFPSQFLNWTKKGYNDWHLYTLTVSSAYMIAYVDGSEVARVTNNQTPGDYVTGTDYIDIGRHRYRGADKGFFNGMIDDVRIYNGALDADAVKALVPEPATILLLGLGGMALLKKRKA